MGMPVVIVPGMMGSSLDELPFNSASRQVWCDRSLLTTHGLDLLQLAEDGEAPGPLAGKPLAPFSLAVAGIYQPLYDHFASRFYSPEFFLWDWRKSVQIAASRLHNRLSALAATGAFAVVAHSAGALVTMLAWELHRGTGTAAAWKRVLWLAPDFGGSYSAAVALAGGLFDAYGWGMTSAFMGLTVRRYQHPTASFRSQATRLRQTVASWPALYELLPSISGAYASLDPEAVNFYQAGNWGASNPYIRQDLLTGARATQDRVRGLVDGALPSSVLVYSDPQLTAVRVHSSMPFDDELSYDYSNQGDGVVPYVRSALPGVHVATIDPDHTSLPSAPGFRNRSIEWIETGLAVDQNIPNLPVPPARPTDPGPLKPGVTIDFPGLIRRADP